MPSILSVVVSVETLGGKFAGSPGVGTCEGEGADVVFIEMEIYFVTKAGTESVQTNTQINVLQAKMEVRNSR